MLWTVKYAPAKLSEVAGNEDTLEEIRKWALEFERGKAQKPLLIHGPPGIGKTAVGKALATEFSWTLLETNASDARDAESLKRAIGNSGRGLFGEQRLILLDEVDGAFDRGEVPELVRIVKENTGPLILTANDMWNKHLAVIRALCKQVEFKKVNSRAMAELLMRIAKAEGIVIEKEKVNEVVKNSSGDVRSAIIDLQSGGVSQRDRKTNVFEAVRTVFKTTSYEKSIRASENLDIDLDMFVKWIEENIPIEYEKPEDRALAFDWLAKSDVKQGQVKKRQYYGLLRYVRALSHAGVSLSKGEMYAKFTPYQFPSYIKTLAATKARRGAFESVCSKLARVLHCSKEKIKRELPLLCALPVSEFIKMDEDEEAVLNSFSTAGKFKPDKKEKRKQKQQRNQVSGV